VTPSLRVPAKFSEITLELRVPLDDPVVHRPELSVWVKDPFVKLDPLNVPAAVIVEPSENCRVTCVQLDPELQVEVWGLELRYELILIVPEFTARSPCQLPVISGTWARPHCGTMSAIATIVRTAASVTGCLDGVSQLKTWRFSICLSF